MQYFMIFITVVCMTAQNVFQKQYNISVKNQNVFLFSAVSSFFGLLFFVVASGFTFNFDIAFIPYSIAFAVSYGASAIFLVLALKTGSMALTGLVLSYSLIIPTLYGVIVLHDPVDAIGYIGMALLVISLFLLNKTDGQLKITFKWVLYVFMSFLGNGLCSTVQKMQQTAFDGAYKSEFMIVALALIAGVLLIAAFIKGDVKQAIGGCLKFSAPNGISNGAVNLLVMVLSAKVDAAILFPTLSAGGIVISFFIALFVYKEKLTIPQMIGYAMGTSSVVLLNL